ncbi:hypothetical protein C8024_15190 [Sphingopyxis sp. BSNA05]|nr:hypothetical protein [Sphingopyxis sp. BSNA05]
MKAYQEAVERSVSSNAMGLILMHHPANWMADWCENEFDQITNRTLGPSFLLHGHVHVEDTTTVYGGTGQKPVVSSGGALFKDCNIHRVFQSIRLKLARQVFY